MKKFICFLTLMLFINSLHALDFLGFEIETPFGLAPCPISLSEGITKFAQEGCSVLTYKTIRSTETKIHPAPNFLPLECTQHLNKKELTTPLYVSKTATQTWANSYGIGCNNLEWVKKDIQKAKSALHNGQVLIVSIYGQQTETKKIEQDFADLALFAKEAGADIIEANLSCPNLAGQRSFV